MKRIGVISDTHMGSGRAGLPAAVTAGFEGTDLILHAGDLTHIGVIDELELVAPVKAVCGNCDIAYDNNVTPDKRIVKVEKVTIGMVHSLGPMPSGFGSRAGEIFGDSVDCVVFGHSHRPYNDFCEGVLLFNPGSARDSRSERYCSYGILEVDGQEIVKREIVYF